ncbi:MAG: sensor histidine kinase, partial [Saprospiraceae bacterium]
NDYTFEVQAQNEDGYWSQSTVYDFSIQPPWWATWWFRTLSFLTLGFIGYRFYKYRTDQIKRETAIQLQMTNLEKSALQAQMNPHFIFNCLNSIQNFILKNDTKKAVEYLSRFARLVRHNLNASVKGEISLEEEVSILDNYLALERERFDQRFDYKINVNELLEDQFIEFPPMLIQPYVENAVVHGLAQKEDNGKVDISFNRDNGNLVVTVKDNGIGYRKNDSGEKSNRHKSVGMTITQKRLELLDANSNNAVKIKILHDPTGIPNGTVVTITIKIKTPSHENN